MTLDNAGAGTSDNPSASTLPPDNGSMGGSGDWKSGLSEDNRKLVENKGWKSLDDSFSSYTNLETEMRKTARLPSKDAAPEEWQKVFDAVRPEKADGYDFKLPEGLPDNFAYDKTFADEVKGWMHDAGLHPAQAQKVHDKYIAKMAEAYKGEAASAAEAQAAEDKAVGDAHATLVKAWGSPETETYKQNVTFVDRALSSETGLFDAFKASGFMAEDGAIKNPLIAQTLAKWGKQLFAEDTLHKGDGKALSINPFHKDTEHLGQQGQLLRNDPQRAKELIVQSGRDPARWGL